ncbi:MAG: glycosyltransferase [Myxococcota bacterium]|nr:glycosyltransferase [Myxococcota bacterium]
MRYTISVIVPTLNRSKDLSVFVESLKAQTIHPTELVIVDAGAESDLEQELRMQLQDTDIQLQYVRSIPGTSLQRNVAMEIAVGDIFFFFDDDIILEPTYIEETLPCFDLPHNPPVGAVLGTFTSPYTLGRVQQIYSKIFRISHTVKGDRAKMMGSSDIQWLIRPSKVVPVPVCSGGRVAYRRECFEKEKWDDFLPGYTMGEDVEISYRISKNWTLVQTPDALLFHKKSDESRDARPERIARRIFSRFYIFNKNLPKTPRNIGAFLWWNIGVVSLYGLSSLREETPKATLKGIKRGYHLCLQQVRKGSVK